MNAKLKGYIAGAVGAAAYGTNPLFALPLYDDGMTPPSVLFLRYLIAMPIVYAMLRLRGRGIKLENRRQLLPLVVLGLMMATSSLTLFFSYTYMPAGIASTILFIYPIIVAVIMSLVYHEKLGIGTAVCILTALLGIYLLYDGGDGMRLNTIGTILIVVSALTYAVYIVGVNRTSLNTMPTLQTTFYIVAVCDIVYFAYLRGGVDLTLPSKWYLWLCILALAVLPTALSFTCTTLSIQNIGSTPTAILGALEPATAVIIGLTVFHEQITTRIAIGLLLIIVSVVIVIAFGAGTDKMAAYLNRLRHMFPRLNRK